MRRATLAVVLSGDTAVVLRGAVAAGDRDEKGTVVDVPTIKVETERGRAEAPFTDFEADGGETHIRVPFVDIDVPIRDRESEARGD